MGGSSEPTRTAEQLELLEKLSALTHDYELVMEKLDSLSIDILSCKVSQLLLTFGDDIKLLVNSCSRIGLLYSAV